MAQEKQDWKSALYAAKQEGNRQDDRTDSLEKKVKSRWMFRKRKLDKDVRRYINEHTSLRSSDIERIGRKHGFYVEGTLSRKD